MNRLNSELVHDLGDGRFVTFAVIVLSPGDPAVLSMSAGHGPLLMFRHASMDIERYGADVLPLGVIESDEESEATRHVLDDGDIFLLVTDGFFEWSNPSGEQYGTTRLNESLQAHGRKGGDELIRGLLADLETFVQGTPQPDDLTAVVIRRVTAADRGEPG